jgi:hypothetical protein
MRIAIAFALTCVACVDPLTTQPKVSPAWEVNNVAAYADTATGLPLEQILAWDLRIEGGTARWRDCSTIEECTDVERSRPAKELLGVERVGKRKTDNGEVDVVKLSLAPKPTYVVPVRKAPR